MQPKLVAVMGPTASGKTALAEAIADYLRARLINADAFQIYRGMDIGTAKPTARDRYHLLDIREPSEGFGVGEFIQLASRLLKEAYERGQSLVVVGGTGLYIRALMEEYEDLGSEPPPDLRETLNRQRAEVGLSALVDDLRRRDAKAAGRIDLQNPIRVQRALERTYTRGTRLEWTMPPFGKLKIALDPPVGVLAERITQRVSKMVQNGWVDEVARLLDSGFTRDMPGFRAIGYTAICDYLENISSLENAQEKTVTETNQYAKRQRTWMRSEPNVSLRIGDEGSKEAWDLVARVLGGD